MSQPAFPRWGLNAVTSFFTRDREEKTERGEDNMKTEAEIEVIWPQAKPRTTNSYRKLEEAKDSPRKPTEGVQPLSHLGFGLWACRTLRKVSSYLWYLLQQLQESNTLCLSPFKTAQYPQCCHGILLNGNVTVSHFCFKLSFAVSVQPGSSTSFPYQDSRKDRVILSDLCPWGHTGDSQPTA